MPFYSNFYFRLFIANLATVSVVSISVTNLLAVIGIIATFNCLILFLPGQKESILKDPQINNYFFTLLS